MHCLDATFKGNISLSAGDFLRNNESFTSMDCECKLVLIDNGNLILFSLLSGSWHNGWESGTAIFDYSEESVSKMEWDEEHNVLVLNEYVHPEVLSMEPIRFWSTSVAVNVSDAMLILSDDCCLEL